ncbi:glutamate receptor ionotropic, NMDA 1-like [Ptychodera flava]|uniref:glutamate receptor ionotropic, NMDA 1-like n=1 Tax=Ptychodera flava TaxID=63121 RepID=UPI00396A85F7
MAAAVKIVPHRFRLLMSFWTLLAAFFQTYGTAHGREKEIINIGAMLSSEDLEGAFYDAIEEQNEVMPKMRQLNGTFLVMDANPIQLALSVCQKLVSQQVYAVIASHPPSSDLSPVSISYTCGFYRIPVIGISCRESIFSDKNIHMSFLRTVPPYSHQAHVWADILRFYEWERVVTITSSDQDGRAVLSAFKQQEEDSDGEIKIEESLVYKPGGGDKNNMTELLLKTNEVHSRVFLLYANEEDAIEVYRAAKKLNMTDSGNVWLVTEQAITGRALQEAPTGIVGLRLANGTNELAHIQDSIQIISKALTELYASTKQNISKPPSNCRGTEKFWKSGPQFYKYLLNASLQNGATGRVEFDQNGDRISSQYEIVNIIDKEDIVVGTWPGPKDRPLRLERPIVWPGGDEAIPEGYQIAKRLEVVTIRSHPFVFTDKVDPDGECPEVFQVKCQGSNKTDSEPMYCCSGFCIDLLNKLAEKLNFTYHVHLVADGHYGAQDTVNGTNEKKWNGMVGELLEGKADLIVAPLTINNERAQYIDFSKPFKYQGLTILVRKGLTFRTKEEDSGSSLTSFLQPFEIALWLLVGLSVHVVALILYLLDRFSPFGRFKLANESGEEEDALNLSSAMWFSWGVLFNSGIGEGTPRSFSARVLGMVWAGFAMIMVASYTANLAAFLVLDRPEASITGINDPRLRNPSDDFMYATVKGSSVEQYFRRQVELSSMYMFMQSKNYDNASAAITALRNGQLDAFIWDSAVLDYEAARDCNLVTVGELFSRSGFGIGAKKGSPLAQKISLNILHFHESGIMERLDSEWITFQHCDVKDNQPATLGLKNMAGVFILVAGGIFAGVFLVYIEVFYKRHQDMKEKQIKLAKAAAEKWRGNVEKRRTLRQQQKKGDGKEKKNGKAESPPQSPQSLNGTDLENQPVPSLLTLHTRIKGMRHKPRDEHVMEENMV